MSASDICDLVFVLGQNYNTVDQFIWIGRSDTYVRVDGDNNNSTFPCDSQLYTLDQSISRLLWNEIQRVQILFRGLLSSSSLHQGSFDKRKGKVFVSNKTFCYITQQVERKEGVSIAEGGTIGEITYELQAGLQSISRKQQCLSTTISFSRSHRVKLLADTFGSFSIFGIRN